jgi:hypothetical protein
LTKIMKGQEHFAPRRPRIKKEDSEKFGFTTGCPRRRAANRGSTAVGHSKECRKRITVELEEVGDEFIDREQERFSEYLETEETKKEKAKMEETTHEQEEGE